MFKKIFILAFIFTCCVSCKKDSDFDKIPPDQFLTGNRGFSGSEDGILMAAEWNDLKNWDFWKNFIDTSEYKNQMNIWGIYPQTKYEFILNNNSGSPLVDLKTNLISVNNQIVWTTRSDSKGNVLLWNNFFSNNGNPHQISINLDNSVSTLQPSRFEEGIKINYAIDWTVLQSNLIEIAFVFDVTASMDSLKKYFESNLPAIIQDSEINQNGYLLRTACVFYKDHDEDFLLRKSDFKQDLTITMQQIINQQTGGGGDYPEAMDEALLEAINKLSWSDKAFSRIIFLMTDAPPHQNSQNISNIQKLIVDANAKGIRIIPITQTGVATETEILFRMIAMATKGTYVFVLNDAIQTTPDRITMGQIYPEKLNTLVSKILKDFIAP